MKKSLENIEIHAPARIHISLVCMGDNEFRSNGGAGFAIQGYDTKISAFPSDNVKLSISETVVQGSSLREKVNDLENYLSKLCKLKKFKPVEIVVQDIPPRNSGFGTGTSLELSCIESIFLLNGIDYTSTDVVIASRRGGTSGVGVHTYFEGGFVIDLGHKPQERFLPSSLGRFSERPPVKLGRWQLPDWKIGIFLRESEKLISHQSDEIEFFKKCSNLSLSEMSAVCFYFMFGLVPGLLEEDIEKFSSAINSIQETTWKRLELEQYGSAIFSLRSEILKNGALAVGMSSMGPLLYLLVDSSIENVMSSLPVGVEITQPDNIGRKIFEC